MGQRIGNDDSHSFLLSQFDFDSFPPLGRDYPFDFTLTVRWTLILSGIPPVTPFTPYSLPLSFGRLNLGTLNEGSGPCVENKILISVFVVEKEK